jgi:hypothetical protein
MIGRIVGNRWRSGYRGRCREGMPGEMAEKLAGELAEKLERKIRFGIVGETLGMTLEWM